MSSRHWDSSSIQTTVKMLAYEIVHSKFWSHDEEYVLVGVLQGAFIFMADLVREIYKADKGPKVIKTDFVQVSSYGEEQTPGKPKLVKGVEIDLVGKRVLLVEDIVDTGKTMDFLLTHLKFCGAKEVKVCSLTLRRGSSYEPDFYGFCLEPGQFLRGYGLDDKGDKRYLPYLEVV
jgi:hypoxanthine phosphoribosyltransferase